MNLTLEDCIGICDLDEDEIDAIAEHEHVPEIIAVGLAEYLIHSPDGVPKIRRMILDDIAHAEERGDVRETERLRAVLKHFVATHPQREQLRGAG
jgi:hypothetical protein